jgi:hypothetical protein
MGALKLSNLLQLDRFEEDLNIRRMVLLKAFGLKVIRSAAKTNANCHTRRASASDLRS